MNRRLFLLALAIMLADLLIFGLHYVDTGTYVAQIEGWRHLSFASSATNAWDAYRAFKPFYGVLGLILFFLSPVAVLFVVNACLFLGLTFIAYAFFKELGFMPEESFLGTFWTLTLWPALVLGFAAGTDLGGWFFCFASIVLALRAIAKRDDRMLMLASLVGFLGATAKETGVLGLFFAGLYLLAISPERGWRATIRSLAALCIPFLVLEAALLGLMALSGFPGFFGWVAFNNQLYGNIHTFKYFLGSEISTFTILWMPVAIGLYALIARRIRISRNQALQLAALFVAALPVLYWPTFTDRILYIECIALVPLALYGARVLRDWAAKRGFTSYTWALLYIIPLAFGVWMAIIGGHDGLYRLADELFKR